MTLTGEGKNMSEQQEQIDVNRIGCRIVDVHNCLQKAFEEFSENGDGTLEGLAKKIQEELSNMPVFLMGTEPQG
jgi:hypothetical protein